MGRSQGGRVAADHTPSLMRLKIKKIGAGVCWRFQFCGPVAFLDYSFETAVSNGLTRRCAKVRTKPVQLVQWRPGRPSHLPRAGVPALFSSTVKDQSVQWTIEASRRIQERSRTLVRESSMLIATAISLGDDARAACGQSKPKKPRTRSPNTKMGK
jgi:hypothetical protein